MASNASCLAWTSLVAIRAITGRGRERAAAADYVAKLSPELAKLTRQHGLETLGYILDMAPLEAENANCHMNGRR